MNIYYTNGFNIYKEIGEQHNQFGRLIDNPNDFIVFMDQDCMMLTPNAGKLIYEAVEEFGGQYPVMGPLTNRIGLKHQLYDGLSPNYDVKYHSEIARDLSCKPPRIKSVDVIAGMMMIVNAGLWRSLGGFRPGIYFDQVFCSDVLSEGYKIGVLQHIYCWHSYRIGDEINPAYNYHHLL